MKAIEVMGTVNEHGQLSLDIPLTAEQHTRVKVIVMLNEDPNHENNPEVDEEISESAVESFRQGWCDVITGNTLPVSQLWEGIDGE
ncbi:hypothetical protein Cri9333_2626 [Crinalium epipsammum PCC 9333]|uniref:Uncharacterized protein n=1 Tax=Crinalium epipsammum PCC 9333 TaxID=1173022 RepID=K9W157_9CYAN|nr:hypothetical protein [Crinalium epipsammum]AFZ13487.1 hypothetical protein Cri9333_2626 [Crinalium epipsammum PCC 9333]